jgi:RES domain-containing protein
MITAWRIVKRKRSRTAFSGEGARQYGGRWNSRGVPMAYTAASQSLAALEMVVHLDSSELLHHYVVFEVGIDESLIEKLDRARLPRNWRADPPPAKVRELGNAWAKSCTSAVLQVPSATLPAENNFLLNPRHPDFPKLVIGKPSAFQFDPRLAK